MAVHAHSRLRETEPIVIANYPLQFLTATFSLDGHDAVINITRRLLQEQGIEVIHLGHNRSVDEIVTAAIQEDVDGIAISSYQGGHMGFFRYLLERLQISATKHLSSPIQNP